MALMQEMWTVVYHDGSETDFAAVAGLGPIQALQNAGLMITPDVKCIRPSATALVDRGEA